MSLLKKLKLIIVIAIFFTGEISLAQKIDAEILLKHDVYTTENSKLIIDRTREIVVHNRRGERITHFSILEYGENNVKINEAYIIGPKGRKVRQISKKDIEIVQNYSYESLIEDDYYKKFTLRHNEYPYIIYIKYREQYKGFFSIANWTPVYHPDYPTQKAILELNIPENYKVHIKEQHVNSPEVLISNGKKQFKWASSYKSILKNEVYCPPFESIVPNVIINPEQFIYGIEGKQDSWESFGDWIYNLNENLLDLPLWEQQKIDHLIAKCKTQDEIISKLYQYLQDNTRYVAVQLGIGGLKSFPANYVAENKYGDCKALSNYMKAILSYAGIDSKYTLVFSDKDNPPINVDIPGQQFNHVILMVPNKKDTTWLECTSNSYPAGYVGTSIQDRWVLPISKNASSLIKTPSLTPEKVKSENTYTIELKGIEKDKVHIRKIYRGRNYEALSYAVKDLNSNTQKEIVENIIPFSFFELKDFNYELADRNKAEIALEIEIETTNQLKKYGNDLVCNVIGADIPEFEAPYKRSLPVWISYPMHKTDSIIYILPDSKTIERLPEDVQIKDKYGQYSISVLNKKSKIILIRSFQLYAGKYGLDEYELFYSFIQEVSKLERKNVFTLK